MTNKIDEHHIGSDIDGRSKQGSRKRTTRYNKNGNLIGVENVSQQDEDIYNFNIFSEDDYGSKE